MNVSLTYCESGGKMRVTSRALAAALAAVIVISAGCSTPPPRKPAEDFQKKYQQTEQDKAALDADFKRQMADANAKIADLQKQLADARSSHEQVLTDRDKEIARLQKDLQDALGLTATIRGNGVAVPLDGDILFDSGQAVLKDNGIQVLQNAGIRINDVITKGKFNIEWIRIDGHTDSDQVVKSRDSFKDNWDLGAARAMTVRRFLHDLGGWDQYKLYIASYAETAPVAKNDTKEGKAKNRRVEIYIVPAVK